VGRGDHAAHHPGHDGVVQRPAEVRSASRKLREVLQQLLADRECRRRLSPSRARVDHCGGFGYSVKIDRLMPIGVGLLLVFLGNYLTRVEPNWFVGIRTPWTLSSDTVWRKTHRTSGGLLVIGGLLLVAVAFLPRSAFLPLLVAAIVIAVVIPIVQSYILWKREQHDRS
jgi:hypothetical protein